MKGMFGWPGIFLAMIAVTLFSVACDEATRLPADVEKALTDYWQSLPADPTPTYEIMDAWPGDLSAAAVTGTELEVWCVAAKVTSGVDGAIIGENVMWLVTRPDDTSPWQATMLATMSSMWPYEACGQPLS